jgi:uncharacterized protein
MAPVSDKLRAMQDLLKDMGSVIVAFSGGIDSSLVLKVAYQMLGSDAIGVTAVSPTFPEMELEAARRIGGEIGARHLIIHTDQLQMMDFVRNDAGRCYHCKTDLYRALDALRRDLKVVALADGTNLDDLSDDRPGLTAAREWGVRSPLVEAQLAKTEIRTLAKDLGLSNWNKPAAACLSSRIPRGTAITVEKLTRIEQAEAALWHEGFRQYRVRDHGDLARIELALEEMDRMQDPARRVRLSALLKECGFRYVTLDLDGYRQGGANG